MHAYTFSFVLLSKILSCESYHRSRKLDNQNGTLSGALGQHGVNIMAFTKEFNERTQKDIGYLIPVVITVYADRSFSFITKTPPAAVLIKKAVGIESGSGVPNKTKVASITKKQLEEIASTKMPDLNAANLETAISMIAGTCRSMGVTVTD